MINQKQFPLFEISICKFQIGKLKTKNHFCLQSGNFPQDKRHPGHQSIRTTVHGSRSHKIKNTGTYGFHPNTGQ
jgi:hypothetical protein